MFHEKYIKYVGPMILNRRQTQQKTTSADTDIDDTQTNDYKLCEENIFGSLDRMIIITGKSNIYIFKAWHMEKSWTLLFGTNFIAKV